MYLPSMSDTEQIKDKIDIVDLIGEYVQLKPAGINHKGLCPFHNEKSPSFMANRERQSWHCFGCSKGGDIFSFLEEIEGMEFVEALRMLAERAGVQLAFKGGSREESSQKTRIKDINTAATRFFYNFLIKMPASKSALGYLHERGLKNETIEEWQIGYVPDQWDLLTQYLLKKGHGIDDLVAAGLTIKRDNANAATGKGFYDRFRGRIMFPIQDVHGSVVGFTGRVLVETERSGGKYVNTPQTLAYDKSRVVFGLNKAKQEIKSKDLIVMVEGQTDVISSHQAGMKNVVASSGTALTEQQVKLLKRYSSNINMAFDSDEAGQKAAKRGIDITLEEGMNINVIQIPEGAGKDPDECLKKNKEVWFNAVGNTKHIMQWYLGKAVIGKDLSDPKHKQQVVNEVLPEIARVPFAVEKDHWLRELGACVNVDVSVLREDLERVKAALRRSVTSPKPSSEAQVKKVAKPLVRLDLLSERFFALLLKFGSQLPISNFQFQHNYFSTTAYSSLYTILKESYTTDISKLRDLLNEDNQENIVDILLMKGELEFSGISEKETKAEAESLITQIKDEWTKGRRLELQREIGMAEKAGDQQRLKGLAEEFSKL